MSNPMAVCYGAGVNTIALLVGLSERGIRPDAIVFSDTGDEKPETYEHMRGPMSQWCASAGFPTITEISRPGLGIGKTGDRSLESECLRLGNVPSRAFGFSTCADKWKIDPFKRWAKTWPPAVAAWAQGGLITRVLGFDANEERRISEATDKGMTKWYPLIEWGWTRDKCEEVIRQAGVPVPPKSACFYCPSSTKTEILELGKRHPDLLARAIAMESAALATGRWKVKGLGRRFAWGDLVAADESQRKLFPETPVESCSTCVFESEA